MKKIPQNKFGLDELLKSEKSRSMTSRRVGKREFTIGVMLGRASRARSEAQKALRSGNKVKHNKFCDVARVWEKAAAMVKSLRDYETLEREVAG